MRTEPVAYEFFTSIDCRIVASRIQFDPNETRSRTCYIFMLDRTCKRCVYEVLIILLNFDRQSLSSYFQTSV